MFHTLKNHDSFLNMLHDSLSFRTNNKLYTLKVRQQSPSSLVY